MSNANKDEMKGLGFNIYWAFIRLASIFLACVCFDIIYLLVEELDGSNPTEPWYPIFNGGY